MEPPEPVAADMAPEEAVRRIRSIREQYRHGLVDRASFEAALRSLQFTDANGEVWTLGARSERWYRWVGKAWSPESPPAQLFMQPLQGQEAAATATAPASAAVLAFPGAGESPPVAAPSGCPHCGADLKAGRKFCTSCGKAV